jgi:glycine dehydrogenase
MNHPDVFVRRHIGPDAPAIALMLESLGYSDLEALIVAAVPADIRLGRPLQLPAGASEPEVLARLAELASKNQILSDC